MTEEDFDFEVLNYRSGGEKVSVKEVAFGPADEELRVLLEIGLSGMKVTVGNGPDDNMDLPDFLRDASDLLTKVVIPALEENLGSS